jgi:ankyrin repeat protein
MDIESFVELVTGGDEGAVHAALEDDQSLANAKSEQGVPVLMLALYHRQQATAAVIAEAVGKISLLEAAALGRSADVSRLLSEGADIAQRSSDGFTSLHYAAFFAHIELVKVLLEAGADPAAVANNPMKVQPLHSAAAARLVDAVELLLDAGAPVDATQEQGFTALHAAAHSGDVVMGRLLLGRGADPALATDAGKTAFDLATEGQHRAFLSILPA